MRKQKFTQESDGVGFKINGSSQPKFQRKNFIDQKEIDFDIPNGDIIYGRKLFEDHCQECHHLDYDSESGPALRSVYLRKAGTRKNFKGYSYSLLGHNFYWTRMKLWEFIDNPELMVPETTMNEDGIHDPSQIASIIEYLVYLGMYTQPMNQTRKK